MKLTHCRKLLQDRNIPSPSATFSPDPLLNTPSSTPIKKPFKPNAPFDSSMALAVLILLTALFFMSFFSVYLRRLSSSPSPSLARIPPLSSSSRSYCSKGLDPSTVGSLPLVPYTADAKHPIIDCVICLSEFEEKESLKMIPHCRHLFHPSCIDTWLSSHVTCPLCRSTRISVPPAATAAQEEVPLGVAREDVDCGVSEFGGNSTVDEGNTWRALGSFGLRRTCSCSSLGSRPCLRRSTSF